MGQKVRFAKTVIKTIDAIQFDGNNHQEILDWVGFADANFRLYGNAMRFYFEGNRYTIVKGDWVMRYNQQISVVKEEVIKEFAQGKDGWRLVPVIPIFTAAANDEEPETTNQE